MRIWKGKGPDMRAFIAIGLLTTAFIIGFFYPELVATIKAPLFALACIIGAFLILISGKKGR